MIRLLFALMLVIALAGCTSEQAAFHPSGAEAERINILFWIMTIAGGIILFGVIVATGLALSGNGRIRNWLSKERFVIGAGIAFPVITLILLLLYSLFVMRAGAGLAETPGALRISISGEQWWWRVIYTDRAGNRIETANELHIPTHQPVVLELTTPDVIHSFWVPELAGKLDMIPGRTNALTLIATAEGISRGQCAEYCGGAHAFMAFHVVAQSGEDFAAWIANEAGSAKKPERPDEKQGAQLFLEAGCGGCHAVRGTQARGTIGPDLTHVGARMSLGAATLENDAAAFAEWITNNQHIKPGNNMPNYKIFSPEELSDLALYLESLQ